MTSNPDPVRPALVEDLAGAREVLTRAECRALAADLGRRAESVSGWTVGQQLAHVGLVAGSIATALRRLVRRGGGEATSRPETRALLEAGVFPRGVAQAPASLVPADLPAEGEIRALLRKAQGRWTELGTQEAAVAEARGTLPHPLLGPLDAREWARFAHVHGCHHLAIVDEILAAKS